MEKNFYTNRFEGGKQKTPENIKHKEGKRALSKAGTLSMLSILLLLNSGISASANNLLDVKSTADAMVNPKNSKNITVSTSAQNLFDVIEEKTDSIKRNPKIKIKKGCEGDFTEQQLPKLMEIFKKYPEVFGELEEITIKEGEGKKTGLFLKESGENERDITISEILIYLREGKNSLSKGAKREFIKQVLQTIATHHMYEDYTKTFVKDSSNIEEIDKYSWDNLYKFQNLIWSLSRGMSEYKVNELLQNGGSKSNQKKIFLLEHPYMKKFIQLLNALQETLDINNSKKSAASLQEVYNTINTKR